MKDKTRKALSWTETSTVHRVRPLVIAAFCALICMRLQAAPHVVGHYQQVNLVSDISGVAMLTDTNLVNAWGLSFSATSPFWVSDNGTGRATLYAVTNDASGLAHVSKVALEVPIPGEGNPTGQVFNNQGGFNGDIFLFVSEDGTISGWRMGLSAAEVLASRSNAVYKGVTLASTRNGPLLLAANFSEGTIDAYGTNSMLLTQFSDPSTPEGYAPFNVQAIEDMIFVTFAKQDADKEDDVAGKGNGVISVFDLQTGTFVRFATGKDAGGKLKEINSPWGIALAPSTFGEHAGELLVGNFGSGTIMAFTADGEFRGLLKGSKNKPIEIEGLWALAFGNGSRAGVPDTLYFTAGPEDETHGLFGSIEPVVSDGR